MRRNWAGIIFAMAAALGGCETTSSTAPPVTAALIQTGARQHVDPTSLTSGRSLFVNRCTRCHALPAIGEQSADEWPGIVDKMSKRAGLKADETKSLLAYILAAQAAAR